MLEGITNQLWEGDAPLASRAAGALQEHTVSLNHYPLHVLAMLAARPTSAERLQSRLLDPGELAA